MPRGQKGNCEVCNEVTNAHIHYGGRVCHPCRAFFRRKSLQSAQFGKAIEKPCKNIDKPGRCIIARKNRNSCKSCRFEKCIFIGMKLHLVSTQPDQKCVKYC